MKLVNNQMARRKAEQQVREEGRLPPGQSLTLDFPVLHAGDIPQFDPAAWDMRAFGLVEQSLRWNWQEFQSLPTMQITTDIHCVTRWSKFDMLWEGVRFRDFAALVGVKPEAKFVIAHCDGGHSANLPLEVMYSDDVLLAYKFDGQYLAPEHGFPLRTLVPQRYFWKSAKWLRAIEFSSIDKPGFWEQRGYHNDGDPWKEERTQRMNFF